MTISEIVARRGIGEILHFTTNTNLTGILASNAVKPRSQLPKEKYLEYIFMYNCPDRSRDAAWHGYVSLSVTQVNTRLFGISMNKWHQGFDGWWCILSFDPEILAHPGVIFATTNNMYTGVRRVDGAEGLELLFSESVVRWEGCEVSRHHSAPANQPTCEQAEVLYPGELSLDHLKVVYAREDDSACAVESLLCELFDARAITCCVRPELFC